MKFSPWLVPAAFALLGASAVAAPPAQMSGADARHLLSRTGFSATQQEVDRLTGKPASQAVQALIQSAQAARPLHPPPAFVAAGPVPPSERPQSVEDKKEAGRQHLRDGLEFKSWWLREMIEAPAPLREHMTLFWHNHFATSQQRVTDPLALWRQQDIFRTQALGNFSTMLHAVARDPAMLIYLDGARNRKAAPNENFAREVMELFTLGEASQGGGYTEQDIKEAARAFTGWTVDTADYSAKFRPGQHDAASKTILGRTGDFDGDATLDILLAQPAAARFVVGKLWKEFVSPTPDPAQVDRIAARFRDSGYDIGVAMKELLTSDGFWMQANRGTLVKSPVDLVVGTVRQFGFTSTEAAPFALKTAQLGQNLLAPPNVKGWPGQKDWIDATTLLERKRFTEQLFKSVETRSDAPPMAAGVAAAGKPSMAGASMADQGMAGAAAGAARPDRKMKAEFGDAPAGRGNNRQMLYLLGREGTARLADGVASITFEPDRWLAQYGAHTDRVPTPEVRARLTQAVLAVPPTQTIPDGTVGVAYLRSLTLDPAYQLK